MVGGKLRVKDRGGKWRTVGTLWVDDEDGSATIEFCGLRREPEEKYGEVDALAYFKAAKDGRASHRVRLFLNDGVELRGSAKAPQRKRTQSEAEDGDGQPF